jgi:hypothetical protein
MSENLKNNATRFDRLVDGELSTTEYQALLATLDDEPAGWRQCALAFLEAQALGNDLASVRRSLDLRDCGEQTGGNESSQKTTHSSQRFSVGTLLAVALSFLFAFTLGAVAPRIFGGRQQEPALTGNNVPAQANVAGQWPAAGGETRHQAFRPVGNVRLVMDGASGESSQSGDVPVYDVGQDLDQFLSQNRPALAPELIELLQQRGHEVVRQEQYVPAQLEDGRQVIVPVERYLITPVSQRAY